ncbi:hypothetical protein WJX81_005507 [Elliptochloris bilobata]|uniref:Uncharacterized protein n=1 Tax=Elliptochloris bilobata TaxID=381761 RepID=A0AAW1R065_9CHLO
MDGDGEARRPLLSEPASADERSVISHPPVGTEEHDVEQQEDMDPGDPQHFSDRAPWLRAAVLGANDGLVSVSSIMLGVGAGSSDRHTLLLSGLSALVAGALSMAVGEYISVSSQRDSETADVETEREEQARGPAARRRELEELVKIYVDRGLEEELARKVAIAFTKRDPIRTHARDELGIDVDELANPLQAALASLGSFVVGAGIPLLAAAFSNDQRIRLACVLIASTAALLLFGAVGAWLGGAKRIRAALRVLVGGWLAMGITAGTGRLFGEDPA